MANLTASLTLRPTRIGFLVDPHDLPSLRQIFQICTCLWGGSFNPIIPVTAELPEAWKDRHGLKSLDTKVLSHGYIRFFEPDVFVEATEGLSAMLDLPTDELTYGHSRVMTLATFLGQQEGHRYDAPFSTDVFGIYRELYEREFKFVPRHDRRVASMACDSIDGAFVEAAFGGFSTDGPFTPLAEAYKDAFDPVALAPTAENWVKVYQDAFRLPLHFTKEHITTEHNGWSEPTLFVVDPTSPLDLIDLWNLRLFHRHILPVNINWLVGASDFLSNFLTQNHRPLPENPHGVMIHPTIQVARSISEERARKAVAEAGLTTLVGIEWAYKFWYDDITGIDRDDYVMRPRRMRITSRTTALDLPLSDEGKEQRCRFTSLSPLFVEQYGNGFARWVNVLCFQNYGTAEDLALALPSSFTGDSSRRLRMGDGTIVSREGFVLPQQFTDHGEYFLLLRGKEAIAIWLKARGVDATASDPGRIADQILASLDGFWSVGLLADCDTLKLLDEMSKSVTKYADGKTEEFPDRSIDVKRWKDLVSRRANNTFNGGITLDRFIDSHVLRLGLVLECTNCRKKNWFGIEGLKENLTCERCLKTYPFPQGSLSFGRTPWQYRVIGPYSVPNYAEGAYSTVLTLSVFARRLGSDIANITYATGQIMKMPDMNPFEVDFTFWYQRKRLLDLAQEPILVFGEAKSFAAESFKPEDITRMRIVGEKFPGSFLTLSTLKTSLSETERQLIVELANWGRTRLADGRFRNPVIVLTGTELFSSWRVEQSWKELGGKHAAAVQHGRSRLDDLWTLANLTQQLYLDLPDFHARTLPATLAHPPEQDRGEMAIKKQ